MSGQWWALGAVGALALASAKKGSANVSWLPPVGNPRPGTTSRFQYSWKNGGKWARKILSEKRDDELDAAKLENITQNLARIPTVNALLRRMMTFGLEPSVVTEARRLNSLAERKTGEERAWLTDDQRAFWSGVEAYTLAALEVWWADDARGEAFYDEQEDQIFLLWKSMKNKGSASGYPWLSLSLVKKVEPRIAARGVSKVARGQVDSSQTDEGFLEAYKAVKGDKAAMANRMATAKSSWAKRRNGFIARHIKQMKTDTHPSGWDSNGNPTDRHLALVAWAYSPTPGRLEKWISGSANRASLSPLQRKLLKLAKRYRNQPEVAIRTIDLLLNAGLNERIGVFPRSNMLAIIKDFQSGLFPQRAATQGPSMSGYLQIVEDKIRSNTYMSVDLTQEMPMTIQLAGWLAVQVKALLADYDAGKLKTTMADKRWMSLSERGCYFGKAPPPKTRAQDGALLRTLENWTRQLPRISDWISVEDPNLAVLPSLRWNQAVYRSGRWHNQTATGIVQVSPGEVVWEAPDGSGWSVHRLSVDQLDEEGSLLNHCVGLGGYDAKVERGDSVIFSLREPSGKPRITFEYLPARSTYDNAGRQVSRRRDRFTQAKGRKDRLVGSKKTTQLDECLYTRAWLESRYGDGLADNAEGRARVSARIGDTVGSDFDPCRAILQRMTGFDPIDKAPIGQVPAVSNAAWRAFLRSKK